MIDRNLCNYPAIEFKSGPWHLIPRHAIFLAILIVSLAGSSRIDGREIREVNTRYLESSYFARLSEYLSGKENHRGRTIVRTNPDTPAGHYLLIEFDEALKSLPVGSRIQTRIVHSASKEVLEWEFTLEDGDIMPTGNVIYIGFTGHKELPKEATILAWKINLLSPAGDLIDTRESYLWRFPQ